ncbi:MAG: hypothetical protein H0V37_07025 [Chloroflexia bacterium]|nr:hypothetical protein [Chloroflexia bacterium]
MTLTGPGGIGKSRLAVQLAIDLQGRFADGVAWVPLHSVRDIDALAPSIAKVLGIGEFPDTTPFRALTTVLRTARLLLVLDNFEQVHDAGPQVAELLMRCPHLVALVTSQTLPRVSGEQMIQVRPLDLPTKIGSRIFARRSGGGGGHSPVPGSRPGGRARICPQRGHSAARRRYLSPPGRHTPGDRAGGGAGQPSAAAGPARPAGAPPAPARRWAARPPRPPAHNARRDRLELRSPHRQRTIALPPHGPVPRRLSPRCRRRDWE